MFVFLKKRILLLSLEELSNCRALCAWTELQGYSRPPVGAQSALPAKTKGHVPLFLSETYLPFFIKPREAKITVFFLFSHVSQ